MRHVRHQMTELFSGAHGEHCIPCDLSQARDVRSALVNKLYCTDVCCECVSCLHKGSNCDSILDNISDIFKAVFKQYSNSIQNSNCKFDIFRTEMQTVFETVFNQYF